MILRLGILFMLIALDAQAVCNNLRLNNLANATYSFNTNSAPSLVITARRSGVAGGCNYFIVVSYGSGGSFSNRRIIQGANNIPIQIYKDAAHTQIIKNIPEATTVNDGIVGVFPAGSGGNTANVNYYPMLGTTDYSRFGAYSDTFTISIYEGVLGGASTFKDSRTVTFSYTMPKRIDLSLVNTGAAFDALDTSQTMNFGTLTPSAAQNFDLKVKYNAGYSVRFSSLRNGALKHSSLADTVPYSMTANSVPVNLAGSNVTPVLVSSGTGVSPAGGRNFNVVATIGALGLARAGSYSDVITITVATTE